MSVCCKSDHNCHFGGSAQSDHNCHFGGPHRLTTPDILGGLCSLTTTAILGGLRRLKTPDILGGLCSLTTTVILGGLCSMAGVVQRVCERDTLACWLTLKASNISCYNKKIYIYICSVLFFGLVPPYDSLVVVTDMRLSYCTPTQRPASPLHM